MKRCLNGWGVAGYGFILVLYKTCGASYVLYKTSFLQIFHSKMQINPHYEMQKIIMKNDGKKVAQTRSGIPICRSHFLRTTPFRAGHPHAGNQNAQTDHGHGQGRNRVDTGAESQTRATEDGDGHGG